MASRQSSERGGYDAPLTDEGTQSQRGEGLAGGGQSAVGLHLTPGLAVSDAVLTDTAGPRGVVTADGEAAFRHPSNRTAEDGDPSPGVLPLAFRRALTSITIDRLCSEEDSFLFDLQKPLPPGLFLPESLQRGRINVPDSVSFSPRRGRGRRGRVALLLVLFWA